MEHHVTATIELRRYAHDDLDTIRDVLLGVHADAYAAEMDDPFNQRFPWFVNHWGGHLGFACVIAYDGSEPVGFAYGAPATDGREWWREHLAPVPTDPSTFAVSELMVRVKWRKQGLSERLHEALLGTRDEALAVLLVDTTHPKVQSLYESWKYRKVGERQPFPDSPRFAVMVRDLKEAP
ncbi:MULTISPECIES: GNAT family N-acetyltransferase [unclassified Streptomyces]|uniref:GNAT family N-acetyltransferase n=1 Tax=unclassified Streptomyces TaxID=2593676 RepID=UPI000C27BC51|nr:GNAT family N-acetyltransferase [Streptomyces sp. CB02959]PJN40717.1 GNAT family N-acetyltransferase [Streptomyces sp. CB02959]